MSQGWACLRRVDAQPVQQLWGSGAHSRLGQQAPAVSRPCWRRSTTDQHTFSRRPGLQGRAPGLQPRPHRLHERPRPPPFEVNCAPGSRVAAGGGLGASLQFCGAHAMRSNCTHAQCQLHYRAHANAGERNNPGWAPRPVAGGCVCTLPAGFPPSVASPPWPRRWRLCSHRRRRRTAPFPLCMPDTGRGCTRCRCGARRRRRCRRCAAPLSTCWRSVGPGTTADEWRAGGTSSL